MTILLTKLLLVLITWFCTAHILQIFLENLNKYVAEFISEKESVTITIFIVAVVGLYVAAAYVDLRK